jgi:hypothetical protein
LKNAAAYYNAGVLAVNSKVVVLAPSKFTKKVTQNVAKLILFVKIEHLLLAINIGATFVNFEKLPVVNSGPFGRKFAQSVTQSKSQWPVH